VIPSFGGWSADQGGTEIADSCKDVGVIAAAYEDVITRYDVTRLDMDVEGRSLNCTDGIDRRNRALKLVQDWAAQQGRPFQVSYTLPTSASGLEPSGVAILQNAIANGTRVDDYPKKTEMTTLAHARQVLDYARANGLNTLSIWAIQRDNGGCPGNTGSSSCSGIVQDTWDFTHLLQPFTGP
jgi:hypothetical protein